MATETVTVWLTAVQYSEGDIGSDTEFDISVNRKKPAHLAVKIRPGATRLFNIPVFMQAVKGDQVEVSVSASVLEEDLVASDRGKNILNLSIPRAKGGARTKPWS